MHYFATIKAKNCDDTLLDEVYIGYSNCGNHCIRISQDENRVELTVQMGLDLIDALLEWQVK